MKSDKHTGELTMRKDKEKPLNRARRGELLTFSPSPSHRMSRTRIWRHLGAVHRLTSMTRTAAEFTVNTASQTTKSNGDLTLANIQTDHGYACTKTSFQLVSF